MPAGVVYLDNHATTRVDPRVVEAMLPWLGDEYGNPGSLHEYGEAARGAVETARETIASAIDAEPAEIVFTSGATESNNLAIRGVAERERRRGDHRVSVKTEHPAVLDPLARLGRRGYSVVLLPVEQQGSARAGWLDPQRVADAVTDETCLVSVMLGNNEIGVVQPIEDIAQVCREHGVLLHCDATQAVGKIPVSARELGVDLMSFTSHKLHGPKGVGALFVRRRDPIVRLDPLMTGGGQERGRRSGTLNVSGIVGFARAIQLCLAEQPDEPARQRSLRDSLYRELSEATPGVRLIGPSLTDEDPSGHPRRLPHNLNVHLEGLDGEAMMLRMPRLAVSSGAACSSTDPEPSHVLRAIGLSDDEARCTLRIGLGRFTSEEDIEVALQQISAAAVALRAG